MQRNIAEIPNRLREEAARRVNSLRAPAAPAPTGRYKILMAAIAVPLVIAFIDVTVDAIANGHRR